MERDFSARTDSSEKFAKQMKISERVALFSISPLWCPKRQLSSIVLKVSLIQGLFSVNGTTDYQKEFTSPEFRLTIAKLRRLLPT